MSALAGLATVVAPAAVNVELPHDRLTRQLGLVLLIDVRFVQFAAAAGAGVRQGCLMDFVDLFWRRHRAMAMPAVTLTAFASGRFGVLVRRPLGKRCGLAFAGAFGLIEALA